jgi:co-chaperonin GroES (HSP10)
MARTLSYGYLEKGFAPPKARGEWVLVEVVDKDPEKKTASGIIITPTDLADNKPYFIVRGLGTVAQENLPDVKNGDVIEGGGQRMVSFTGPEDIRYGLLKWEDIGVVYTRVDADLEEPSVYDPEAESKKIEVPSRPKLTLLNG